MYQAYLIIFLLVAIGLVTLIMLQHSNSSDIKASLSANLSGTLLSSNSSSKFLSRMTAVLATIFFCLCLILSNINNFNNQKKNNFDYLKDKDNIKSILKSG